MLSVVIPTLNSAAHIGRCIERVTDADEIIVADGGSTDDTLELANRSGARVVVSEPGRGVQLGAGAEAAHWNWLLFLHSDTLLEPGWRESVDRHISWRPNKAGYFQFRLDAQERQARLIENGVAVRSKVLGLPYGDQALLISRQLYREVGGYSPMVMMEDVDIARRIRRDRLVQLGADAVTSAERWRRDGWSRRTTRNLACLLLYGLGLPPETIARIYA